MADDDVLSTIRSLLEEQRALEEEARLVQTKMAERAKFFSGIGEEDVSIFAIAAAEDLGATLLMMGSLQSSVKGALEKVEEVEREQKEREEREREERERRRQEEEKKMAEEKRKREEADRKAAEEAERQAVAVAAEAERGEREAQQRRQEDDEAKALAGSANSSLSLDDASSKSGVNTEDTAESGSDGEPLPFEMDEAMSKEEQELELELALMMKHGIDVPSGPMHTASLERELSELERAEEEVTSHEGVEESTVQSVQGAHETLAVNDGKTPETSDFDSSSRANTKQESVSPTSSIAAGSEPGESSAPDQPAPSEGADAAEQPVAVESSSADGRVADAEEKREVDTAQQSQAGDGAAAGARDAIAAASPGRESAGAKSDGDDEETTVEDLVLEMEIEVEEVSVTTTEDDEGKAEASQQTETSADNGEEASSSSGSGDGKATSCSHGHQSDAQMKALRKQLQIVIPEREDEAMSGGEARAHGSVSSPAPVRSGEVSRSESGPIIEDEKPKRSATDTGGYDFAVLGEHLQSTIAEESCAEEEDEEEGTVSFSIDRSYSMADESPLWQKVQQDESERPKKRISALSVKTRTLEKIASIDPRRKHVRKYGRLGIESNKIKSVFLFRMKSHSSGDRLEECSGYALKKGAGQSKFGRKNWKRRFFVLRQHSFDYYSKEGGEWKGGCNRMSLGRAVVVHDKEREKERHLLIRVNMSNRLMDMRVYTEKEKRQWLHALNQSYVRAWNQEYQDLVDKLRATLDSAPDEPDRIVSVLDKISNLKKQFTEACQQATTLIINELSTGKPSRLRQWMKMEYVDDNVPPSSGTEFEDVTSALEDDAKMPDLRSCGMRYNGIMFRLLVDKRDEYGCDDAAMKAALHERRMHQWLSRMDNQLYMPEEKDSFQCTSGLFLPLMCMVDYLGYRMCGIAEFALSSTTQLYGYKLHQRPNSKQDIAHPVWSLDDQLNRYIGRIGQELNIRPSIYDPSKSSYFVREPMPEKAENFDGVLPVEGHISSDSRRYICDLATLSPQEAPSAFFRPTNVFCRLRPELMKRNPVPLPTSFIAPFALDQNPAHCAFGRMSEMQKGLLGTSDYALHMAEKRVNRCGPLEEATLRLHTFVIPGFARWMDHKNLVSCSEVVKWMHCHGINLRHLGLVLDHVQTEPVKRMVVTEMLARSVKNTIRRLLRKAHGEGEGMEIICQYLRSIFGYRAKNAPAATSGTAAGEGIHFSDDTVLFWLHDASEMLQRTYPGCRGINPKAKGPGTTEWHNVHQWVHPLHLLQRIATLLAVSLTSGTQSMNTIMLQSMEIGDEDEIIETPETRQKKPLYDVSSMAVDRRPGLVGLTPSGEIDVSLFEPTHLQLHQLVRPFFSNLYQRASCMYVSALQHTLTFEELPAEHVHFEAGATVMCNEVPDQHGMVLLLKAIKLYESGVEDPTFSGGCASDTRLLMGLARCHHQLGRACLARSDYKGFRSRMRQSLQYHKQAVLCDVSQAEALQSWGVVYAELECVDACGLGNPEWNPSEMELLARRRELLWKAIRCFQWALVAQPNHVGAIDAWTQWQRFTYPNSSAISETPRRATTVVSTIELSVQQLGLQLLTYLDLPSHGKKLVIQTICNRNLLAVACSRPIMELIVDTIIASEWDGMGSAIGLFYLYRLCYNFSEHSGPISLGSEAVNSNRLIISEVAVGKGLVPVLLKRLASVMEAQATDELLHCVWPLEVAQLLHVLYEVTATHRGVNEIVEHRGLELIAHATHHCCLPSASPVHLACLSRLLVLLTPTPLALNAIADSGCLYTLLDFLYHPVDETQCSALRALGSVFKLYRDSKRLVLHSHFYLHVGRILRIGAQASGEIAPNRNALRTAFYVLMYLTNANHLSEVENSEMLLMMQTNDMMIESDVVSGILQFEIAPVIVHFLGCRDEIINSVATSVATMLCFSDEVLDALCENDMQKKVKKHLSKKKSVAWEMAVHRIELMENRF